MEKAVLLYNSKTGTTAKYAGEIGNFIEEKDVEVQVSSIQDYHEEMLDEADYVLLGCWTNGLMVILQHPEVVWKKFAAKLPSMSNAKLGFFTTYKILTGSMFRKMNKELDGKFANPSLELKSRDGTLSRQDEAALDTFVMGV